MAEAARMHGRYLEADRYPLFTPSCFAMARISCGRLYLFSLAATHQLHNERTIRSNLVHHVHDHLRLADGKPVEMFSNCQSKLVFTYLRSSLPPCHCGRVAADARICKDSLIERGVEGRGCI